MNESNNEQNDYPIMDKVVAARAMLNQTRSFQRKNELDAFMSIFHPKVFADRERMLKLHQAQINPEEFI